MIIINNKIFNKVCHEMHKFCEHNKFLDGYKYEQLFHNVFFINKNLMCATNGKIMTIRDMSDCVINDERFAFPCNIKPTKFVTKNGEQLVIESKREDYFSNDKKEVINFNWEKVIPNEKPRVTKEYNFSDYNPTSIPFEKHSEVIFYNNEDVVFNYNDYYETMVTYSDVVTKDDFFDKNNNEEIKTVKFPMYQIYWILNHSKNFIYQEYDIEGRTPREFIINKYKFLMSPMC